VRKSTQFNRIQEQSDGENPDQLLQARQADRPQTVRANRDADRPWMDTIVKISYDPTAEAIYVQVNTPGPGTGETRVDENGTIVDVDDFGNPRGYEFLAVNTQALPLDDLPGDVASALRRFVEAGHLSSQNYVEVEVPSA
jgi:uncharacterized protein YuzE